MQELKTGRGRFWRRRTPKLIRLSLIGSAIAALGLSGAGMFASVSQAGAASVSSGAFYSQSTSVTCPGTKGCTGANLVQGDVLSVTFSSAVTVAANASVTLTDGTNTVRLTNGVGTIPTSMTASASTLTITVGTLANTAALTDLEVVSASGITDASANPWNLLVSGEVDVQAVSTTLTSAIAANSTNTTLQVAPLTKSIASGDNLSIAGADGAFGAIVASANAAVGATTINVQSFTAPVAFGVGSVVDDNVTETCSPIANHTRLFQATNGNCDIGFGSVANPSPPTIFDEIALPTVDLPGPPDDGAPEVIVNCEQNDLNTVYDLNTGATLGQATCGATGPAETSLGNTNSQSLAYISTSSLASFEPIGVVQTNASSTYVSMTGIVPMITAASISANTLTLTLSNPVYCQSTTQPSNPAAPLGSWRFVSPYWSTNPSDLVYPKSVSCASANAISGSTSTIVITYQNNVPTTGITVEYEGYGPGGDVIGATGSNLAGESEASQSFYLTAGVPPANPGEPSITSFTGVNQMSDAGGSVTLNYATTDASVCSVSATPATSSITMPFAFLNTSSSALPTPPLSNTAPCPSTTSPGTIDVTVPANHSSSPIAYSFTLSAKGLASLGQTTVATKTLTITEAAAPSSTSGGSSSSSTGSSSTANSSNQQIPGPVATRHTTRANRLAPRLVRASSGKKMLHQGERLMVFGSHFQKRFTARLDGKILRSVRFVSPTRLLVICPKGHGVEYLTLHTAHGTSNKFRLVYTKASLTKRAAGRSILAPRLVRASSGKKMLHQGERLMVFGSHFQKRFTARLDGKILRSVRFVSPTRLLVICPKGHGVEYLTLQTAHGTSNKFRLVF